MSFRELRRKKQLLPEEETIEILKRNTSGTLACSGDDDYPYAVPMSYVYTNGKIYFHCAVTGHKLDAVKRNSKVSFCIVDKDDIVPEKITTFYRSAIVFGRIKIIEDPAQKRNILETLAKKYSPNNDEGIEKEINTLFKVTCVLELNIDHMTGKESLELVNSKKN
ncbi:MAG: pyridoxamine 5'-phosphate oxidase family protein [Eubacterium sp.]|nr:pyridoxamine 5'-phosphate oxidase family protein [Eubacterium sp.]